MSEIRFERWRAAVMREGRGFVAMHEAGHTVMAYLLHKRIDEVIIIPDADRGLEGTLHGYLQHGPIPAHWNVNTNYKLASNKRRIEREAMIDLAGPAVDEILNSPLDIGSGDLGRALNLLRLPDGGEEDELDMYYNEEKAKIELDRLASQVRDLLIDPEHWRAIEHIADVLLAEGRIGRKRIRQIIGAAIDYAGRPDPI